MSTDYNRIKVADLETNEPNKILKTNGNGELEFGDISQKESDPVSAITTGIVDNTLLQELGGVDKMINGVRIGRGNSNYENNLVIGKNGLASVTTGQYNVAIGAGDGETEGSLQYLTTGSSNTIIGANSGVNTTTGTNNTAVGTFSLNKNATGIRNTAIGNVALSNNTAGDRNTAVGDSSLYNNTTGVGNTAVGNSSLTNNISGGSNTAMGRFSLSKNTEGFSNVGIGYNALSQNTVGQYNVGIGYASLRANMGGYGNTALGTSAGCRINSGYNIAIGYRAFGFDVTDPAPVTGDYNIIMGFQAGRDLTTGSRNILIENITNASITTGSNNIMLNPRQKSGITTGSGNTIIGGFDGAFNPTDSELVVLATGTGKIAIMKKTNDELVAPNLTNALITSGGNKSLLTKEYLETNATNLSKMVTLNTAPASATAMGTKGDIRIDADYVYVCVNTNIWKRSALTAW